MNERAEKQKLFPMQRKETPPSPSANWSLGSDRTRTQCAHRACDTPGHGLLLLRPREEATWFCQGWEPRRTLRSSTARSPATPFTLPVRRRQSASTWLTLCHRPGRAARRPRPPTPRRQPLTLRGWRGGAPAPVGAGRGAGASVAGQPSPTSRAQPLALLPPAHPQPAWALTRAAQAPPEDEVAAAVAPRSRRRRPDALFFQSSNQLLCARWKGFHSNHRLCHCSVIVLCSILPPKFMQLQFIPNLPSSTVQA